jgi:hypothetical protein
VEEHEDLELTGFHSSDWDSYIAELNRVGVTLHENDEDSLLWTGGDSSGNLTVKKCYDAIISTSGSPGVARLEGKHLEMEVTIEGNFIFLVGCAQQDLNLGHITKERLGGPEYFPSL